MKTVEELEAQISSLETQQAKAHSYIIDVRQFLEDYVVAFDNSVADDYNFRDRADNLAKRKFSK